MLEIYLYSLTLSHIKMNKSNHKYSAIKRPAVASIWYAAAAILGRGIGFIFTPIFTRLLSAEEYGLFTLYTTWLGVFTIISTLEIGGGVLMRALQKKDWTSGTVFFSALGLQTTICAIVCVIYCTFYDFF